MKNDRQTKAVYLFCFLIYADKTIMSCNTQGLMSSTMYLASMLRNTYSNCDLVLLSEHKLPPKYSKYLER